MEYPQYRQRGESDEYLCILSDERIISVRNGVTSGYGTIDSINAVSMMLELEPSNKKDFKKNLTEVKEKIDTIINTINE